MYSGTVTQGVTAGAGAVLLLTKGTVEGDGPDGVVSVDGSRDTPMPEGALIPTLDGVLTPEKVEGGMDADDEGSAAVGVVVIGHNAGTDNTDMAHMLGTVVDEISVAIATLAPVPTQVASASQTVP